MKKEAIIVLCAGLLFTSCGYPTLTEGRDEFPKGVDYSSEGDSVVALHLPKGEKASDQDAEKDGHREEFPPSDHAASGTDKSGKKTIEVTAQNENAGGKANAGSSTGAQASDPKDSKSEGDKGKDEKKDPSDQPASSVNQPGEEKSLSGNKTEKEVKPSQDGYYAGGLSQEKSAFPIASDVKIEGDHLIVTGSLNYSSGNDPDLISQKERQEEKYIFTLTKDTKFETSGGMGDPDPLSREEFLSLYQKIKDGGLGLVIKLHDGKVQFVRLTS